MFHVLCLVIPGILFFHLEFSEAKPEREVVLSAGESLRFSTPLQKLRISAKPPFRARPLGAGLLEIQGLKPGQGTIFINNKPQEIIVLNTQESRSWKTLENEFKKIIGIRTKWEKGILILTGRLYSKGQWGKIQRLLKNNPMKWTNHLLVSEDLQKELQKLFSQELRMKKENFLTMTFRKPWSTQMSKNLADRETVQSTLNEWGMKALITDSSLELKPVIRVNMAIAELKLETLQKLGMDWPTSFSAKIINFSEIEFDDLVMAAHALESQGRGKVLAKPNILARSGSEAEFLAGGEFPIKIKNFASQDVVWKKYGVLLKILPTADHSGKISLKIDTEISQIDMANAVDGVPGLTTNRVSSHFDLAQSQTVALSGLLRLENHEKRQGLSFLQRIPVLGLLFSSRDFIESKSELVIFVRPEIEKNLTEDFQ